MSDYVSDLVEGGYMSGRPLTVGGVRTSNEVTKNGSKLASINFFYFETGRDGKRRIIAATFPMMANWGDQLEASPDRKGFVAANGATKPGILSNQPFGLYVAALRTTGFPKSLITGDWTKLLGTVLVLTDVEQPGSSKSKSVDPDEKQTEAKKRMMSVPAEIITLPADNKKVKLLTDKEIDQYLAEQDAKYAARRAKNGKSDVDDMDEHPASAAAAVEEEETEEAEEKPVKKTKKPAPAEEEEAEDSFGEDTDEDAEEAEPEADAEEAEDSDDSPAGVAKTATLAILKKAKKIKHAEFVPKFGAELAARGVDKKTRAKALELISKPSFFQTIDGIGIKGNLISLS
jgi:hypothetical protein